MVYHSELCYIYGEDQITLLSGYLLGIVAACKHPAFRSISHSNGSIDSFQQVDYGDFDRCARYDPGAGHRCGSVFARLVETALREVDRGVIEAAQGMGASTGQIVMRVLLPEARPGLLAGVTITLVTLVSYTAMSGMIGGGGLGDLAIRYGYYRYEKEVMIISVVLMVILVQLLQMAGDRLVKFSPGNKVRPYIALFIHLIKGDLQMKKVLLTFSA